MKLLELLDVLVDGTKVLLFDNHIGGARFMYGDEPLEIDDIRGMSVEYWIVVGVEIVGECLAVFVEEDR